jgi:hypothetical protein
VSVDIQSFHELTAIPSGAFQAPKVSRRKLLVSTLAGHHNFRSADPDGYLMPDLYTGEVFIGGKWGRCTARPEQAELDIGTDTIGMVLRGRIQPDVRSHPTGFADFVLVIPQSYPQAAPELSAVPLYTDPAHVLHPQPVFPVAEDSLQSLVERGLPPAREPSTVEQKLPADATAQQTAARIAELSDMSDGELARPFNVTRETFCRWRTGQLRSPTAANRRRLGLLARLLEEVAGREVAVDQWLRNVSEIDALTPYQLLERGRIDDAELLAARLPGGVAEREEIGADGAALTSVATLPAFARGEQEQAVLEADEDDDWLDVDADVVEDDE